MEGEWRWAGQWRVEPRTTPCAACLSSGSPHWGEINIYMRAPTREKVNNKQQTCTDKPLPHSRPPSLPHLLQTVAEGRAAVCAAQPRISHVLQFPPITTVKYFDICWEVIKSLWHHLGVELHDSKDSTAFAASNDRDQHPISEVGQTLRMKVDKSVKKNS